MKKLIILGNAVNADLCPFDNEDYEIWTVAVCLFNKKIKRIDKVFEIHRKDEYILDTYKEIYKTKLPVYVQEKDKKIKNCKIFPIDKIEKKYGNYFTNSLSLILVYAIEQGYKDITLYGIDLDLNGSEREIAQERPNLEYWIGYFRGKGIKINTDNTPLCKSLYFYGKDDIVKSILYYRRKKEDLYKWILRLSKNEKDMKEVLQKYLDIINFISYL